MITLIVPTRKAQKLKKTLLSIDEIHALDDNSDSGSGGGSGSGGSGGGGAGGGVDSSLKKTDGLLEKYKSSIKDLYSLGKYIGDTIADSLILLIGITCIRAHRTLEKVLQTSLTA